MKFTARITVMPRPELLAPLGKAVPPGLEHPGPDQVGDMRIGKHISLEAGNEEIAREKAEKACSKLLADLLMESYSYSNNK